jgi:hypothetical protein
MAIRSFLVPIAVILSALAQNSNANLQKPPPQGSGARSLEPLSPGAPIDVMGQVKQGKRGR